MVDGIQIPGPGSAMALAAGSAVVIAGYGNLTDPVRILLVATGLVFAYLAVRIERMHTQNALEIAKIQARVPKRNRRKRVP